MAASSEIDKLPDVSKNKPHDITTEAKQPLGVTTKTGKPAGVSTETDQPPDVTADARPPGLNAETDQPPDVTTDAQPPGVNAETDKPPGVTTNTPLVITVDMLGVDLDAVLIKRSQENNPYPEHVSFEVVDLMDEGHRSKVIQPWLYNHKRSKFDLVTCFSVTLWIHINHGDDKLKQFLLYISSICRYLVIEPQPWKCYKTAWRRMKKLKCEQFELYDKLEWREHVDEEIITYLQKNCGMTLVDTFGETQWERRVCLLQNKM